MYHTMPVATVRLLFASYHTRNDCLFGLHCFVFHSDRLLYFRARGVRSSLLATARRYWLAAIIGDSFNTQVQTFTTVGTTAVHFHSACNAKSGLQTPTNVTNRRFPVWVALTMFPLAARWEVGLCGRNRVEQSPCFGSPDPGEPATWTFQDAQLGKTAMIDAIPGTRAVTVRTSLYRTRLAKPQGRHSPIGSLAVPLLAAAAGIGFNVLVVMTLVL